MSLNVITGLFGSGKSSVLNILKRRGFKVINLNEVIDDWFENDDALFKVATNIWGASALTKEEKLGETLYKLDKEFVIKKIVNNEHLADSVERVIQYKILDLLNKYYVEENEPIFVEIPFYKSLIALLQCNMYFSRHIYIETDNAITLNRVIQRGTPIASVYVPIRNKQGTISSEFMALDENNVLINNDGTLEELEKKVNEVLVNFKFSFEEQESVFQRIYKEYPDYVKTNTYCYLYWNMRHCDSCPFPCKNNEERFNEFKKALK